MFRTSVDISRENRNKYYMQNTQICFNSISLSKRKKPACVLVLAFVRNVSPPFRLVLAFVRNVSPPLC